MVGVRAVSVMVLAVLSAALGAGVYAGTSATAGEPVIRMMDENGAVTYVVPPVHEVKMLGS